VSAVLVARALNTSQGWSLVCVQGAASRSRDASLAAALVLGYFALFHGLHELEGPRAVGQPLYLLGRVGNFDAERAQEIAVELGGKGVRAGCLGAADPELYVALVAPTTAAGAWEPSRSCGATGGAGMSNVVLLLEEEPPIRDLIGKALADAGCRVVACDSFGHLIRAADDWPGAVVVADFWGESDQALDAEERAQVAYLAMTAPTILLSGHPWASEAMAEELGLVAVVRKPFSLSELCLCVTQTLRDWMRTTTP
jgi:CheY-like chemotaxis protein